MVKLNIDLNTLSVHGLKAYLVLLDEIANQIPTAPMHEEEGEPENWMTN